MSPVSPELLADEIGRLPDGAVLHESGEFRVIEARAGDMVWILGGPASCAVRDWELAAWQESITHEVFCCMGDLNPQEY